MDNLQVKLSNFINALDRLKEAINEYGQSNASSVVRDGLIQRFEFTYELAWKTTKICLEDMGIPDRNSPKAVLKEAFAQKIIENEAIWLLILKDRNMTSHIYNEELAREIAERIVHYYLIEFNSLLKRLKELV